jgi:toxin ParE1/3/4
VVRGADCRTPPRVSEANWTFPAREDLAEIDSYHAERDPDFADRVGREAIKAADWLAMMPFAGVEVAPDHRRWRVPVTPYLLIGRVVETGVQILRVWHERRSGRDNL